MSFRQRVRLHVACDGTYARAQAGARDAIPGDPDDDRQVKHRACQLWMHLGRGDRPGPGSAADVEQRAAGAKVYGVGQCVCRTGEHRLDPFGRYFLQLVVQLEDLRMFTTCQRRCQRRPRRIAQLVPELQEGPQVGGGPAGEEL